MANIEEVAGIYGGVNTNVETGESNLPAKIGLWDKIKAVLFSDIKVELTPYQQKVEDEINEFLYQDITWSKVKNFLFQEVTFGNKN